MGRGTAELTINKLPSSENKMDNDDDAKQLAEFLRPKTGVGKQDNTHVSYKETSYNENDPTVKYEGLKDNKVIKNEIALQAQYWLGAIICYFEKLVFKYIYSHLFIFRKMKLMKRQLAKLNQRRTVK